VRADGVLAANVVPQTARVAEEERSHQPSVFSVLRAVIALFHSPEDDVLGLYGAFGCVLLLYFLFLCVFFFVLPLLR